MAGNNIKVNGQVDLSINLQAEAAKQQIQSLQKSLKAISNIELNAGESVFKEAKENITEAARAATLLSSSLQSATNVKTGTIDFSKFSQTIKSSGHDLDYYTNKLVGLGSQGKNAYVNLATAIAKSEIPLKRSNQLIDKAWENIKKTAGWQMSSSLIHGFIGSMQQAVGYAQDLNKSLTDIRIVTGASTEQMAHFAEQANKAAKNLSTTTTDYTKASLIYYQQGLSDQEVKARTETTIKMANATGTSAQKVSDQMTAIWNNYDNGTKSLTHYADVMTALGAATASSTDEIAQGLQKFAAISETVGLSYEYAASALATVTATSRESADVVGNSFKTLFSRIQGLQLGETLDDGTDLNKYSTALAKAGISIKDTSGELKNMDVILNEMGESWSGLERDEKMALAQTVAGVRQYTQLMTLMENWDTFKQNLNVANSSAGTLDTQAAIYAESWEAASNRVRASWEGLWDSLINSDSFISILDGFSSIIGLVENLVDGLGGAGGTLATFGGVLGRVFTPQIASTVKDVTGFFRQLNPNAREEDRKLRQDWLSKMHAPGEMGNHEQAIFNQQIQAYTDESFNRDKKRQFMSAEQIEYDKVLEQQLEDLRAKQRQAAKLQDIGTDQMDAAQQQISKLKENSSFLDKRFNRQGLESERQAFGKKYGLSKSVLQSIVNDGYTTDKARGYYKNHKTDAGFKGVSEDKFIKDFENIRSGLRVQESLNNAIRKDPKYAELKTASNSEMIRWAAEQVTSFNDLFTKDFWDEIDTDNDGTRTANYQNVKAKIIERAAKGLIFNTDDIDQVFKPMEEGQGTSSENIAAIRSYKNQVAAKAMGTILSMTGVDPDSKLGHAIKMFAAGAQSDSDGQSKGTGANTAIDRILKDMEENEKMSEQQKKIQGGVELASGATSLIAANQSVIALYESIEALGRGAGSVSEFLSSTSMLMFNSIEGFQGLSSGMEKVFGLSTKAAAGWTLGIMGAVTALTLAIKTIDNYSFSEKERTASLRQSDAELSNAVTTSQNLTESYKTQNETYLETIENIKTNKVSADQLSHDIFNANTQALKLITQYELTEDQYKKNTTGLIEIDTKVLEEKAASTEEASLSLQRTASLSNIITQRELLEADIESNALFKGEKNYVHTGGGRGRSRKVTTDYYFSDEDGKQWTLEDALKYYGTDTWDKAKASAESKYGKGSVFDELEKQILNHRNIESLLDLAYRNNVDDILKGQNYNLKGYENFANLGYDKYKEKYNERYDTGIFTSKDYLKLTAEQESQIRKYLTEQGYTEIDNIKFKDNQFTYTHGEGETGALNVEAIRKWDAEQAAAEGVKSVFDQSFDVLSSLHKQFGEEAAPGLMSLLTGDDFAQATQKEINAAMDGIDAIQKEFKGIQDWDSYAEKMSQIFGITTQQFQEMFNVDFSKIHINDWLKQFEGFESSARKLFNNEPILNDWITGDGKNIGDNLTQNTLTSLYNSFKQASLIGGEEAGQSMLQGITDILKESNLDEADFDSAIQRLLAIDWSNTLTSAGAAASIISDLGGTLDTTTASWEAFAAAMAAASGAIPDFSELVAQLTQLAGALQNLSKGDTVSSDIVDQLIGMNPEFADLFSKHFSGDYTFLGDNDKVLKDTIWNNLNQIKQKASQIQQKYNDYISTDGKGKIDNNSITAKDIDYTWDPLTGSYVSTNSHGNRLAAIAGYSGSRSAAIASEYAAAGNALNAWTSPDGMGALVDGSFVKKILDSNGNEIFQQFKDGEWTDVTDATEILDLQEAYQAAQDRYSAASGAMNTMLGDIHGLDEANGDWSPQEVESLVSTLNSASEFFDMANGEGFNVLRDEHGIISEAAFKGLEALPETSARASEAINELAAARENLKAVEADAQKDGTITNEEASAIHSAGQIYEQAEANAALQASIDAVAEARGLDAEQVAYYTEQLQNSMDAEELSKYSPQALADLGADLAEQKNAIDALNKAWKDLSSTLSQDELSEDKGKALKELGKYLDQLTNSTLTAGKSFSDLDKGYKKFLKDGGNMQKVLAGDRKEITKLARAMEGLEDQTLDSSSANKKYGKTYGDIYKAIDEAGEQIDDSLEEGLITPESFMGDDATQQQNYDALKSMLYNMTVDNMQRTGQSWEQAAAETAAATGYALVEGVNAGMDAGGLSSGEVGIDATPVQGNASNPPTTTGEPSTVWGVDYSCESCGHGYYDHIPTPVSEQIPASQTTAPAMDAVEVHKMGDAPKGSPAGGGGGGGGAKEPKKVANKFKSQYVKRYKRIDHKIDNAIRAKKSEENKKDYLYGESKIAQMEKINKLAEKEAHTTAERIKESQRYLEEDRKNLIKYMQKYGFEAEFESDGFLTNYEKVWTEIYEEIAALYEDNLLTEEESKIEEDLNIKREELEQALEDYENSLSELADDIEKYEESLYEMYDNKVEALQHKVEFKIELDEDDLEYLDWWIEVLGDNIYNAIDSIEMMGNKASALFNGLNTYQQGIQDIFDLSDDPLQIWATGGLEGVLTQDQVDALRENRDGLMDYIQQLVDLREEIKDKVLDTFDSWQEKLDANIATLEHYTSVIEHFKNIIDIVGKDPFDLSDQFMNHLEQNAINQSMDNIDANKSYYESLIKQQEKAEEELAAARERGDKSSEEHWEEVVRTTTEAAQSAQDALLTSLEDTLTMIAEQFETTMQRAVDTFNEAIYSYGGLEGLSNDYDLAREQSDLIAKDYQRIYELSKINRNINNTLNDSNIIAGKQKMRDLQKEINELQASGVQLSQYDLEYLQAKYDLRVAEIELENAKNNKDTVRLSKDNEGNWSYVYTQNVDKVDEAQQKYEDALYNMQNLSYEYMEEMSSMMVDTSLAMMEEIQNLRIQDFDSYEAYSAEVQRIQNKYADYLQNQENELNKSVENNKDLYNQDWKNYSAITGYKISENQLWADNFSESTLGALMGSDSFFSDFSGNVLNLSDVLMNSLGVSAMNYFNNVETAMNKYGTSIAGFGSTVTTTVSDISSKSKTAATDMKNMAEEMKDAFIEIADYVSDWQEKYSKAIDDMITKISTLIVQINDAIEKSAKMTGDNRKSNTLIGTEEAVSLINKLKDENGDYKFGKWSFNKDGSISIKGFNRDANGDNKIDKNVDKAAIVQINGALITEIDNLMKTYFNLRSDSAERKALGEELKKMFKDYWEFRDIVNRIYDITDLKNPTYTEPASMDTGGYTGEWGKSGKLAMLHEKELVLNANDTSNFLDALNISRDVIHSMIEMNARASSLALGNLIPSSIQDMSQQLEQQVSIVAEFPNATDHNEIEEAFNNLINTASQYANKYKI